MSIGTKLAESRRANKLSQEQLADAAGVTPPYVSKIERDRATPARDTLQTLATEAGANPRDLLAEWAKEELPRLGFDATITEVVAVFERLDPADRERLLASLKLEAGEALAHQEPANGSSETPRDHPQPALPV